MITSRQDKVLEWIIELYRQTEEPVGSKTLLKASQLEVSPATIRNDMVQLENLGFLSKTHTSSGRVPSVKGYKHYVEGLFMQEDLPTSFEHEGHALAEILKERKDSKLHIASLATEFMSSLTNYPSFVLGQSTKDYHFEKLKIVMLEDQELMVILLTDSDQVETMVYKAPYNFTVEDLNKMMHIINTELSGMELSQAYSRLKLTVPFMIQRAVGYQMDFSPLIERVQNHLKGHRYHISGKNHTFDLLNPNIELAALKEVYRLLDGSPEIFHLLENVPDGVHIIYGDDYTPGLLSDINLIVGAYSTEKERISLGILGPVSMPYPKIITMMKQVIKLLKNQ